MERIGDDSILSELFSSNSSEDFIPPTSSDSSSSESDVVEPKRKKKQRFSLINKRLRKNPVKDYSINKPTHSNLEEENPSLAREATENDDNLNQIEEATENDDNLNQIEEPNRPIDPIATVSSEVTPKKRTRKKLNPSLAREATENDDNLNQIEEATENDDNLNQIEEPNRPIDPIATVSSEVTPKKRTRKKLPNPSKWKSNVVKKACQAGEEYTNRRGKNVQKKQVKTTKDCLKKCRFKCNQIISNEEREDILMSYYTLPNATEKRHFILNTTSRSLTARPKRGQEVLEVEDYTSDDINFPDSSTEDETPVEGAKARKRTYSFRYFFHVKGEQVQVCQQFYLGTLDISKNPVYTAHTTKNITTNTPTPDLRGKNEKSRRKPIGDAQFAKDHIASFPTIEAHYCRAKTNRLYLGAHLSIGKMFELYKEKCVEQEKVPVKKSMYHRIFVTQFNLGFHIPKTDRCDVCEVVKVAKQNDNFSEDLKQQYEHHIVLKDHMRSVRKKERENKDLPVLLFDLQNVILTPHAEISSLFYSRKLTNYNLTGFYSVTKRVYCAMWNETIGGRAGNDLASAFRKILDAVFEENDIVDLITWSDSCVPQNRNSMISNAIMHFLKEHPDVNSITMKYSLPGHSCVQEVDNAHSQMEKAMRKTEFYSPIGLIRLLRSVNKYNPYRIIQMKPEDFKNFGQTAELFNYSAVPFSKVSTLKFEQTLGLVYYQTSHDEYKPLNMASIKYLETPKRHKPEVKNNRKQSKVTKGKKKDGEKKKTKKVRIYGPTVFEVKPTVLKPSQVSALKIKDIKNAFPFMPLQDVEYYKVLFKL